MRGDACAALDADHFEVWNEVPDEGAELLDGLGVALGAPPVPPFQAGFAPHLLVVGAPVAQLQIAFAIGIPCIWLYNYLVYIVSTNLSSSRSWL